MKPAKKRQQQKLKRMLAGVRLSIQSLSYLSPEKAGAMAFDLFCKPFGGKLKPDDLVLLETATQKDHEVDGLSIRSYEWGDGDETIMLIHGWQSNSARWKSLVNRLLDSGYHVIAIDNPAHGASSGNRITMVLLASIIKALSETYQPTVLIGHSMGAGAIVYALAELGIPSVNRAVLLAPPNELTRLLDDFCQFVGLSIRVREQIDQYMINKLNIHPDEFSIARFAEKITIEGLVVHDRRDAQVSVEEGKAVAQAWLNARFSETIGLDHALKHPQIWKMILEFLEETSITA